MRTKTLLTAAALAAGALTAMAQSNVYSLNVVGYVNVSTLGGGNFNMIANPLDGGSDAANDITNVFASAQNGDQVYRWNSAIQDFSGTINTYFTAAHSWDSHFVLKPGEGIFYLNSGNNVTNTFVGNVIQGTYTSPVSIVGGGSFNAVASPIPIGGSFTNATVGIAAQNGDQIYTFDSSIQDLSGTVATYFSAAHAWDSTAINIAPGQGFFYLGSGTNQPTWNVNFTVQ